MVLEIAGSTGGGGHPTTPSFIGGHEFGKIQAAPGYREKQLPALQSSLCPSAFQYRFAFSLSLSPPLSLSLCLSPSLLCLSPLSLTLSLPLSVSVFFLLLTFTHTYTRTRKRPPSLSLSHSTLCLFFSLSHVALSVVATPLSSWNWESTQKAYFHIVTAEFHSATVTLLKAELSVSAAAITRRDRRHNQVNGA